MLGADIFHQLTRTVTPNLDCGVAVSRRIANVIPVTLIILPAGIRRVVTDVDCLANVLRGVKVLIHVVEVLRCLAIVVAVLHAVL